MRHFFLRIWGMVLTRVIIIDTDYCISIRVPRFVKICRGTIWISQSDTETFLVVDADNQNTDSNLEFFGFCWKVKIKNMWYVVYLIPFDAKKAEVVVWDYQPWKFIYVEMLNVGSTLDLVHAITPEDLV